jgi:LPS-assembly lipoprotein
MKTAQQSPWTSGRRASSFVLLTAILLLSSCGFHLRGEASLPFSTVYIQAAPNSQFATQLRRMIVSGSRTRIADDPKQGDATLQVLSELREKEILSLSAGGRVREFQLRFRVSYRVLDKENREISPPSEILLRRDLAFNDQETLSKEAEEALLYRDMQNDAVQQLLRRLQTLHLPVKT